MVPVEETYAKLVRHVSPHLGVIRRVTPAQAVAGEVSFNIASGRRQLLA
ncbi:hypothetical protein ABZX92_44995 [Lentzea sp. NPDC006480]